MGSILSRNEPSETPGPIQIGVVRRDVVVLRHVDVGEPQRRLAIIVRQREAAVARDVVAILVVRIEPHRVPAVHTLAATAADPRLATVV
jgi:hypothetical protein